MVFHLKLDDVCELHGWMKKNSQFTDLEMSTSLERKCKLLEQQTTSTTTTATTITAITTATTTRNFSKLDESKPGRNNLLLSKNWRQIDMRRKMKIKKNVIKKVKSIIKLS